MKEYILALDQGTTSSRAIIFDKDGQIKSSAQAEYAQIYPHEGWVEHDPVEIYSSIAAVASEAIARLNISRSDLAAIGITNQRETAIVWDKRTGKPVYNAIVWQCRRTAEYCDKLKADGLGDMIYQKTGLPIDAYFSATKIKWILDNVDGARARAERGDLLFGTVDTYLMWKLSDGRIFATDYTNASRTMLYNIHTLKWDDDLLKLFGIPSCMLPKVLPSSGIFGTTSDNAFGAKVPIAGVAGDQQAALFGQRCFAPGTAKNTFGTGCFLLMNTGTQAIASKHGLITTLAAMRDSTPQYALEGSVFVGGAVVQWLRDEMQLVRSAAETEKHAQSVPDTLGMYIVPAFVGLGAPYWDSYARGTVTGITRGAGKDHFIRAALESIAYQVNDVLTAMEKDCMALGEKKLAVDGGAAANNFLMQFTADITGHTVVRPAVVESTALGAAYLAGLATGLYDMQTLSAPQKGDAVFVPEMSEERRSFLLNGWLNAVKMTVHKD